MTTPVQNAMAALRTAIKTIDGRTGTLARGATSVSATFTRGESSEEVTDADNVVVSVQIDDFIFDAADYDFGAGPVVPQIGDVITEAGRAWEVNPVADGKHYKPHGRDATQWRVHTKEILAT